MKQITKKGHEIKFNSVSGEKSRTASVVAHDNICRGNVPIQLDDMCIRSSSI